MALEATSWDWLRNGVQKSLPAFSLLERVENGISAGMADVNYLIRGVEGWIELKAVDLPKRPSTPVLKGKGLNPEQVNWHLKRAVLGGRTWVFVSAGDYRWLISGALSRQINEWNVEQMCGYARVWHQGKWTDSQWRELLSVLAPTADLRLR